MSFIKDVSLPDCVSDDTKGRASHLPRLMHHHGIHVELKDKHEAHPNYYAGGLMIKPLSWPVSEANCQNTVILLLLIFGVPEIQRLLHGLKALHFY